MNPPPMKKPKEIMILRMKLEICKWLRVASLLPPSNMCTRTFKNSAEKTENDVTQSYSLNARNTLQHTLSA